MKAGVARVAFFPDAYHEIDGVAVYARHFEAFAKQNDLPFLLVHAGAQDQVVRNGSVTRVELRRGSLTFPLDKAHAFDLLFLRHYRKIAVLLQDFHPDVVQITGPSDVGILGALLAHRMHLPLAAFWQTDLPRFAGMRVAQALSFLPKPMAGAVARAAARGSFAITTRFYKIPRLVFAPTPEIMDALAKATGRQCLRMDHGVDIEKFSPEYRDQQAGPFTIGYVGRLSAEKNIRWLARLEDRLLQAGHQNFRIVVVGQGTEAAWLRDNTQHVELCGVLAGRELSRAYANMDVLAFPSETDTFGLVVLEALASGVPAVVTASGGPKFTVQQGITGYVANTFDEFAASVMEMMTRPDILTPMRKAAREYARANSWESVFENVYNAYDR